MESTNANNNSVVEPYIPASRSLPEITFKSIILGIILVAVLGAANTYLGLKVGMTVSASIPAAIISMGLLRFFKNSNILENNAVQTCASCGEALAAGSLFTLPALIILHFWAGFPYIDSAAIALVGGLLGVMFSIPLRHVLINDPLLRFPEGTATANVLKLSEEKSAGVKDLLLGGLVGAFISFCQSGLKIVADTYQHWFVEKGMLFGAGIGFTPALFAAGYIVGTTVAISMLVGTIIGWIAGVPFLTYIHGIPAGSDPNTLANNLWSQYNRYIGVGTILVGGIAAVISLLKPIFLGIKTSLKTVTAIKLDDHQVIRTEKDISIITVAWSVLGLLICAYAFLMYFSYHHAPTYAALLHHLLVAVGTLLILVLGFLLSSVCGYFAGLVGSSVSPISGLTLIAIITTSALFYFISKPFFHLDAASLDHVFIAAFVIVVTAIITIASSISNDTVQDLKAGQLVGATPWKQQVMLLVGAVTAALVIPFILNLLYHAYGIGGVMPHAGMDPSQMLTAPQAGLMAIVVEGIFTHNFKWDMILVGVGIGMVGLLIDFLLKKKGRRLILLALGLGIYLPITTVAPIILGGLTYFTVQVLLRRKVAHLPKSTRVPYKKLARQRGLLLACGIVAGSALMGVILAIPFVIAGSSDVLDLVPIGFAPYADALGFVSIAGFILWIYWVVCRNKVN